MPESGYFFISPGENCLAMLEFAWVFIAFHAAEVFGIAPHSKPSHPPDGCGWLGFVVRLNDD